MLPAIVWIIIFIVSLVALVKGADWLVQSAERIGVAFGMSPFVVGVVIVGIGTSFPELISSFVAVMKDVTEIPVANAVGSNIANILLVVGAAAVIGKRLVVDKDLIDLDLPMIAISTVLFVGVVADGSVTLIEGLLLLAAYGVYLAYTMSYKEDTPVKPEMLPSHEKRRKTNSKIPLSKIGKRDLGLLVVGILGLAVGAKYLIDSIIAMSSIFGIGAGAITIIAVAVGTSLPELLVSVKAALQKKSEIALGNIFGSNAFNILVVVGLPAIFTTLTVDDTTLFIGVPTLLLVTFLFIISGISKRIHLWEGALYLIGYVVFIGKVFRLF